MNRYIWRLGEERGLISARPHAAADGSRSLVSRADRFWSWAVFSTMIFVFIDTQYIYQLYTSIIPHTLELMHIDDAELMCRQRSSSIDEYNVMVDGRLLVGLRTIYISQL